MAKKSTSSQINIHLVTKTPYAGSGPRGIDLYARHLHESLTLKHPNLHYFVGPLGKRNIDSKIVHYTFFDPFFLTLKKIVGRQKLIVTVHDLIPLKFPSHFPSGIKGWFKWQIQKRRLLAAHALVTDSECSKTDIAVIAGYPVDKIHVIPLAAPQTTITPAIIKSVKKQYDLPNKYLLYVGDINWNKNVTGLIETFGQLKDPTLHLVLVGKAFVSGKGTPEFASIEKAMANLNNIHLLGYLPSHHLPAVYRLATLYVQPSWYEGFGFTPLEAMTQECPVLSSNQGSLPEVGGSVVHYFDPGKSGDLNAQLSKILKDDSLRLSLLKPAKKWAATFTWNHVADLTHQLYEQLLA